MSQTPKYDLVAVKALCASGSLDKIWFSAPSRSLHSVIKAYSSTADPKTYEQAQEFVLKGLQALCADDFVTRVLQWDDVADVYGFVFDGRAWYVKFILKNNELEEISFHPPEDEMKTVSGKTIPKGDNT